jgi:hypothetical protein
MAVPRHGLVAISKSAQIRQAFKYTHKPGTNGMLV